MTKPCDAFFGREQESSGDAEHVVGRVVVSGGVDERTEQLRRMFNSLYMQRTTVFSFRDYQHHAERTANRTDKDTDRERYTNFGMGVAGEAGEIVDYLKKVCFHGHELDKEKLTEELGDLLWYIATIANTAGLWLDEIAAANVEKLRKRYPEGFNEERSRERGENS